MIFRIPSWLVGSLCWGGIILLGEDDPRTLRHELEHRRQQASDGLWRWTWRYLTSAPWRLRYEAQAWAAEADPFGVGSFAHELSTFYRCGPFEACRAALQEAANGRTPS